MMAGLGRSALLFGATMLATLDLGAAPRAAEPIKVGSFLALTGSAAFLGEPEQRNPIIPL